MSSEPFEPDWRSHPSDTLHDLLDERDLTVSEFAAALSYPLEMLDGVVAGEQPILPDLAVRLEAQFGTPAEFWMKRQSDYDLHAARERIDQAPVVAETVPRAVFDRERALLDRVMQGLDHVVFPGYQQLREDYRRSRVAPTQNGPAR